MQKGFADYFAALHADFFCLQETKLQPSRSRSTFRAICSSGIQRRKRVIPAPLFFYEALPLSVTYGVGIDELDHEGRMITLEYEKFYLVTCYTPNAQEGLKRIDHRLSWDDAFREKASGAGREKKPVIACGDLNVAHQEIDLKNPGPNRGNPGFSDEERESFTRLLDAGFTDTFRYRNQRFPARTPGGATASTRARRTRAGASTIFSSPTACSRQLRLHRSTTRFSARTIVRSVWN